MQRRSVAMQGLSTRGIVILFTALVLTLSVQPVQAASSDQAFLGVHLGKGLDDELRESLKFKGSGGALIDGVVKDGPAAEAGIEDGDIIIKFGGQSVEDESSLRKLIGATKPGDQVDIIVFRDGEERKFSVKMGETPETEAFTWFDQPWKCMPYKYMKSRGECCSDRAWMGVEMQKLTEQLGQYFKVKDGKGVLISSVVDDSPAQKAGLKAGDVIVKMGDEGIAARSDVKEFLCEKKAGDEVVVSVIREGKTKDLKVVLAEAPEKDYSWYCGPGDCWKRFGEPGQLEKFKKMQIILPDVIDLNDLEEGVEDFDIEIHKSMDDLQEELDQLRKELEDLKEKVK